MSVSSSVQQMGDRSVLQIGDRAIEVYPLASLIRREAGIIDGCPRCDRADLHQVLGCAVDELLGRREIVIKSLGGLKPVRTVGVRRCHD